MPELTDIIEMPGRVHASIHQIISARIMLKLEIRSGMRNSQGSVLKVINSWLGTNHRTKRAAYDALNTFIVDNGISDDKPRTEWDKS